MAKLLASLPSPSSGAVEIGPLQISAYGLSIALGIVAATWLASRRLIATDSGTSDDMQSIALWSVIGGVVGARLYHVITDWQLFSDDLGRIPLIWKGGLGIPGGLIGGLAAGIYVVRRRHLNAAEVLTAVAPAIPLAQSIGRWGNWWNQELYGQPTSVPWALEISEEHLPVGFAIGTTFHPTFLYESLWTLALCGVLLMIDRHVRLRPGRLFAFYLAGYFTGRFWIEGLRIDTAHEFGGLRLNQWVALTVVVGSVLFLIVDRLRLGPVPIDATPPAVEEFA
jgi:prolipoprotein diacylglyceryl transferase